MGAFSRFLLIFIQKVAWAREYSSVTEGLHSWTKRKVGLKRVVGDYKLNLKKQVEISVSPGSKIRNQEKEGDRTLAVGLQVCFTDGVTHKCALQMGSPTVPYHILFS